MNQKLTPSTTGTEAVVRTDEFSKTSNPVIAEQGTTAPTKTEETKKKMVEVDADVLAAILKDLGDLKEKTQQYEQTAPQDQIRKIEAMRASGKLVKSVKVRFIDEKAVLGWKMVKNEAYVSNGKLIEEQVFKVFFEDGSEQDMSLLMFTRNAVYKAYEVISEAKTQTGDIMFTVVMEGGKQVLINSKYIN
jgi:hypothetical protein